MVPCILAFKTCWTRVPATVLWVKNLTSVAQVAVEARVQFPDWHSGLKDPVSPQLWLRFNPWPENFHIPWVYLFKKKKKRKKDSLDSTRAVLSLGPIIFYY